MKKNSKNKRNRAVRSFVALLLIVTLTILGGACSRDSAHIHDEYTCPMHPTVISDKPGSCPVCGMDLVRKTTDQGGMTVDKNLTDVLQSTNESVIAGISTVKAEFKAVPISYEAQGVVTYDTRNIFTISSRVAGRIEKLYVKFPYQNITKGQKVAEIYSPELITAQRELLFLLETDPENSTMIESAKKRLLLLGLSRKQVDAVEKGNPVGDSFTLYSPYSGYVITSTDAAPASQVPSATANAPEGMGDGMNETSPDNTTPSPTESPALVKEGNYIGAGQTLFTIINNSSLRIELDLPADLASTVKKGDRLKMVFGADHEHTATVDFVQPFFEKDREFVKVRVNTTNTEDLHIGHLLQARITSDSIEGMWVPRASVIDLGKDKIIFLRVKDTFKPRAVSTGVTFNGMTQVVRGLTTSDEIATNAQFLIDSESIIKTAE